MSVRVLATPGHTFTHLSYALRAAGHPHAVFSGGSLLYGSTGRPDLLGRAHAEELARAQYGSARRLAAELPGDADVYPTHGFGSFCSATQAQGTSSTIGTERLVNPVLTLDEDSYVAETLAGLDAYPAYYAHMGPANAAGPGGPDLTPPRRADAAELRSRIEAGEWVVDLRARRAFAAGHLAGTLSFDLDGSFATYLGWLIPWDTPLTLLGQTREQVAEAQRELVRIGIDRPRAAATAARNPGPRVGRCAATRSRTSPPWPPSATTALSPSWTSAATPSGSNRTSTQPCTSRCTTCRPDRRAARRRALGALPGRLPGVGRRVLPRRRRPDRGGHR